MARTKSLPVVLNKFNQRIAVQASAVNIYEALVTQQQHYFDLGIIQRRIPSRTLIEFATDLARGYRVYVTNADTVDKVKKLAVQLNEALAPEGKMFLRAIGSGEPTFTERDRIGSLQLSPIKGVSESKQLTEPMNADAVQDAKYQMKTFLDLVGRAYVDDKDKAEAATVWTGVRNASMRLGNTEADTIKMKKLMTVLAASGFQRVLDGGDYIRMQRKNQHRLAFVFSSAGIFVFKFKEPV